jgi:hypothetical protein
MLSSVYCELSSYLTQQYGENKGMQFFYQFCNFISFAVCSSTFSKLCRLIQWHVEQYSVALLNNYSCSLTINIGLIGNEPLPRYAQFA